MKFKNIKQIYASDPGKEYELYLSVSAQMFLYSHFAHCLSKLTPEGLGKLSKASVESFVVLKIIRFLAIIND